MTFYYTYTGFGDIVLDLIGLASWSKFDSALHFFFVLNNNRKPADRVYDMSLFKFNDRRVNLMESHLGGLRPNSGVKLVKGEPGCTIHPDHICHIVGISAQVCRDTFCREARNIRPSTVIQRFLPKGITDAIGIHLRKSDKISEPDPRHGTSEEELHAIIYMLKAYVLDEIKQGNSTYFVCSEDGPWRQSFVSWLESNGGRVISVETTDSPVLTNKKGYGPVLDFFCLTECKKILQGIGYSTFSLAASLVGGGIPLVNLHTRAVEEPTYLLNWWAPVLNLQMANEETCINKRDLRDGAYQNEPALQIDE